MAAKNMNVQMPKNIENEGILYLESDYSSKIVLESSKNPQRFDQIMKVEFVIILI